MQKIVITVIGNKGDVRPALEFAKALKQIGSEVAFIAPPENEIEVTDAGLQFLSIGDPFAEFSLTQNVSHCREQVKLQFELYHEIYQWADQIFGVNQFFAGHSLAELFGKAYSHIFYSPQVIPSSLMTPQGARSITRNRMTNRISWAHHNRKIDRLYKRVYNEARLGLGLPKVASVYKHFIDVPILMFLDQQLFDVSQLNWPNLRQIDFPLDLKSESNHQNSQFKGSHEKIALVSFGSVKDQIRDKKAYYKQITESLYFRGYFCVILDDRIEGVPNAEFRDYLSFNDSLAQFDLAVHHGGIGTSMSCVLHQVPQIILPRTMDQYFWANIFSKRQLAAGLRNPIQIPICLDQYALVGIRKAQADYVQNRLKLKEKPCFPLSV